MSNPEWRIEPLDSRRHDRKGFVCSTKALENYLRNHARQDLAKKVAAVFVLTPDGSTIAGYYTLSQNAVMLKDIPPSVRLPKYSTVPATLLGRLAVADTYRGQRLGEKLLVDALQRSFYHSAGIASFAAIVDAKDETARNFYLRYGFIELPQVPNRLFLPMKTVEQMLSGQA